MNRDERLKIIEKIEDVLSAIVATQEYSLSELRVVENLSKENFCKVTLDDIQTLSDIINKIISELWDINVVAQEYIENESDDDLKKHYSDERLFVLESCL